MKKFYFSGIFAAAFVATAAFMLASCSQDDEYYYDSEMFTRADGMMTRSGGDPGGNEGRTTSQYPSANEILADNVVKAHLESLWQQTVNAASAQGRREYGCYIYYNNGSFSCEDVEPGPINTSCAQSSGIRFTIKNDPALCAVFHTHTTLEYCDSTLQRITGPSSGDLSGSYASMLPCFVYDYEGIKIMGTQSKTAPAKIYIYGLDRRIP